MLWLDLYKWVYQLVRESCRRMTRDPDTFEKVVAYGRRSKEDVSDRLMTWQEIRAHLLKDECSMIRVEYKHDEAGDRYVVFFDKKHLPNSWPIYDILDESASHSFRSPKLCNPNYIITATLTTHTDKNTRTLDVTEEVLMLAGPHCNFYHDTYLSVTAQHIKVLAENRLGPSEEPVLLTLHALDGQMYAYPLLQDNAVIAWPLDATTHVIFA